MLGDRRYCYCSPSTARSGQKCYLCLRNDLLPMCPDRTRPKSTREAESNLCACIGKTFDPSDRQRGQDAQDPTHSMFNTADHSAGIFPTD
jgi:hypothetical protein